MEKNKLNYLIKLSVVNFITVVCLLLAIPAWWATNLIWLYLAFGITGALGIYGIIKLTREYYSNFLDSSED